MAVRLLVMTLMLHCNLSTGVSFDTYPETAAVSLLSETRLCWLGWPVLSTNRYRCTVRVCVSHSCQHGWYNCWGNDATNTQQPSAALQFLSQLHGTDQIAIQPSNDTHSTTTQTDNGIDTRNRSSERQSRSPIRLGTTHRSSSRSQSRSHYDSRHSSSSRERYSTKRSRDRYDDDREYSHSRSRSRHHDTSEHNSGEKTEKLFDKSELTRLAQLAKRAKERGITVKQLMAEESGAAAASPTGAVAAAPVNHELAQQINETRCIRKLFLGNMPSTMQLNEQTVREFITSAMHALGIHTPLPVLNVSFNNASTFAFIEFRSVVDCRLCYTKLQGISLGGRVITVGHSNDYNAEIDAKYTSFVVPLTAEQQAQVDAEEQQKQQAAAAAAAAPPATQTSNAVTSRVILLENMIDESELVDDEEYADLCADVRDECSKYGTVLHCVIPRKGETGCGNIYIKYATADDASKAITGLHNRTFSSKQIVVTTYSEQLFDDKVYNNSVK